MSDLQPQPKPLRLRVRLPSNGAAGAAGAGPVELTLDSEFEFGVLKVVLEENSGIPASRQCILAGFPPKALVADDGQTLGALGLRSGDTLIVQQLAEGVADVTQRKVTVVQGHTKGKYIPIYAQKGSFLRREMPSDHSCLFHAAAYVLEDRSRTLGPSLRTKIAEVVAAHPEKFTAAFLGRPNLHYCSWIQERDSWGGAIELSILSFVYCVEIVALDIQSASCVTFGEAEKLAHVDSPDSQRAAFVAQVFCVLLQVTPITQFNYTTRVFLLYTGRHYDAMAMVPVALGFALSSDANDQVEFSVRDDAVLRKAKEFVQEQHQIAAAAAAAAAGAKKINKKNPKT